MKIGQYCKSKSLEYSIQLLEIEIEEIEKFIKDQDGIAKKLWGGEWKKSFNRMKKDIIRICNESTTLEDLESALSILISMQKEAEKHDKKPSK